MEAYGGAVGARLTLKGGLSLKCVACAWLALHGPSRAVILNGRRRGRRKAKDKKEHKKHKKHKRHDGDGASRKRGRRDSSSGDEEAAGGGAVRAGDGDAAAAAAPAEPVVTRKVGTGRIITSGITVQGREGTFFQSELDPGDAIIVQHPTRCAGRGPRPRPP